MDFLPNWAIDVFKVLGPSAGILLIWWLSHKAGEKRFVIFIDELNTQRTQLIEQIEKERTSQRADRESYAKEFIEIRKQNHENQKALTDLLRIQTAILAKMEPVIENSLETMNKNTIALAVIDNKIDHLKKG